MADSLPAHPTGPRPFPEPEEGMIWGEFCVKWQPAVLPIPAHFIQDSLKKSLF